MASHGGRARFDAVQASAEFASAMRYEPSASSGLHLAVASAMVASALVFVAFAVVLAIDLGAPLFFLLAWAALGGGFVTMTIALWRSAWRFHAAPIVREVARVLDKRTQVSGHESTSTTYFTTLELRDGTRLELRTAGSLSGVLTCDDIGVAYIKLTTLLAFRRFDV